MIMTGGWRASIGSKRRTDGGGGEFHSCAEASSLGTWTGESSGQHSSSSRSRFGARRLLMADIEQRLVRPHVFVTGRDQKTGTWRERQVSRDLGKPLHKMARVQRHEEVGCAGQFASPQVPARRPSLRMVPQAMYWPAPALLEQ